MACKNCVLTVPVVSIVVHACFFYLILKKVLKAVRFCCNCLVVDFVFYSFAFVSNGTIFIMHAKDAATQ